MKSVKKKAAEISSVEKDFLDYSKTPLVIDRKLFDLLVKRIPFKEERYVDSADILLGIIIGHHPSRFKDVFTAKKKYGESWLEYLPTKEREAWIRDRQSIIQAYRGISVALVYALEGLPTSSRRVPEKPLKSITPGLKKFGTYERLAEHLKDQYWNQGKGFNKLGKELGVSGECIEELFKKLHIRSRSRGRRPPRKPC